MFTLDRQPPTTLAPPRFSRRRHWAAKQPISFLMQQAVENPQVLSLAAGLVDQATLPDAEVRTAAQALLADNARARSVLQYGTTQGSERLRARLLEHLARLEGCPAGELGVGTDRLLLTTGSQQLLSLVGQVLLDPGDICLVAAPTYFVFLGTIAGLGARALPVEADADGMRMDALDAELERLAAEGELDRVKLIYLVSYYENPSGTSLSAGRRAAAVDIARRWSTSHRLFILEDAAYRELHYDGPPPPSVWSFDPEGETVILAQTFSKSFSPGLRVGFGVVPRVLLEPLCDRKGNEDFGSANFNQHLLESVFDEGLYEPHVEMLRKAYRRKRDAMLAAAERSFADMPGVSWIAPHGGLYVWLSLPEEIDTGFDGPLFRRAVEGEGVMYVPGDLCFAPDAEGRVPSNSMRLSFGVQSVEGIEEGMQRLARAVRSML